MDDHLLVEALRARDPDAPTAVYDAYADRLYAYCWFQLHDRDAAQVALRDTFVVAEAHIDRLRDPDRFGPWLYAITRLECARRLPTRGRPPDVPVASHDQEDVDQRIMAWKAVLALRPLTREFLELRVRHQLSVPDLAAVFDMPVRDAQAALDRAHGELEGALTAEILAHQGPYGCAERALLLRERQGEPSAELSGRLLGHAQDCGTCGAFRPRTVSAAKVYGLLPSADLPAELRLRVMSCFLDPELIGYRLFVGARVTEFTSSGFPARAKRDASAPESFRSGRGPLRFVRSRRAHGVSARSEASTQAVRLLTALAVVALLVGGVFASVHGLLRLVGWDTGPVGTTPGRRPTAVPGVSQVPAEDDPPRVRPAEDGTMDAVPVSATFPLGSRASSAPPIALPSPPPEPTVPDRGAKGGRAPASERAFEVTPLFLDLAGHSDGSVELRAEGGPITWHATSWGRVRAGQSSGYLQPGRRTTVTVHVVRDARTGGEGGITFQPGGIRVRITWRPGAPGPGPEPSPTPTPADPGVPPMPSKSEGPGGPSSSGPRPPTSEETPQNGPSSASGPPPEVEPKPPSAGTISSSGNLPYDTPASSGQSPAPVPSGV
ncbi:sigma-70 family RNA polymerase sigma factor [Actinomadura graeca]|uniref:Sigma-70 family RNA polymerase sigma factor n=1 Tax=Actinomadura graeca TaxID=2750812 RepID=A0ABX8QXL4_9ACTN|nr:sigma-70 family RNA polymerase sigma factor [Actinomadura graeca]QXJ23477.1 sigma-70 family RNA polymerase sigma factor [Actinomadura graeca]